jgi:glycosyltransferase involved in cell wall biosynthesis
MKKPNISVFFPCYNDQHTIGGLVEDAIVILQGIADRFEVIVVEDGSTDGSKKVLEGLRGKYPLIFRPIYHKHNRGYGGALKSGFAKARYDLVFYTDGDGQYDVKELPLLLSLMTKDVNFINGIKMERQDYGYRVILGNFYALLMRWAFLLPVFDVDCDFRLIRRSLAKKLKLKSDSGSICVELVKKAQKAGAKFRQVSVHHFPRKFGGSQFFNFRHLFKTFRELGPLWVKLMLKEE